MSHSRTTKAAFQFGKITLNFKGISKKSVIEFSEPGNEVLSEIKKFQKFF